MDLFGNEPAKPTTDNERLHNQLIRLGDMLGDGLHHESDGAWIPGGYRRVSKALFPEMYKDIAKQERPRRPANGGSIAG